MEHKLYWKAVGQSLKKIREGMEINRRQFAFRMGVNYGQLVRFEETGLVHESGLFAEEYKDTLMRCLDEMIIYSV